MSATLALPARSEDPAAGGTRVATSSWHASLAGSVEVLRAATETPWRVVRLEDTPARMRQPSLLDDVICLHRGGPKEVQRTRGLHRTTHSIELGALTLMPRGSPAQWQTSGPIAFTHLVLAPKAFSAVLESEFNADRDQLTLSDEVGIRDPLLESLLKEMTSPHLLGSNTVRLYKEALFTATVIRLFFRAGDQSPRGARARPRYSSGGLPGSKLRRVTEFFQEHRTQDIGYENLIAMTGLSRAQFFRAFKQSLGVSPGRYLEQVRLEHAKRCLESGATLEAAVGSSGFPTVAAMSRSFRRCLGVSPLGYRDWYR